MVTNEMLKFKDVKERTMKIAVLVLDGFTLREIADQLNMSKSTVHYDINKRLHSINPIMYMNVKKKLQHNAATKHIRGGEATKRYYQNLKKSN